MNREICQWKLKRDIPRITKARSFCLDYFSLSKFILARGKNEIARSLFLQSMSELHLKSSDIKSTSFGLSFFTNIFLLGV
jgi:hypothetical protein